MNLKTNISNYQNIANAIRNRNGSGNRYKPNEMPEAIRKIGCQLPSSVTFSGSTFVNPNMTGFVTTGRSGFQYLFSSITSLKNIDLSTWDFSNAGTMNYMFSGCTSLETVNFGNQPHIRASLTSMFQGCSKLKTVDLSWIENADYGYGFMFSGCSSLESVNIYSMNRTSGNCLLVETFKNCSSLTSLDLSSWIIYPTSMADTFSGCTSLQHLDIRNVDFSNISIFGNMLQGVPTNCEIIVKDQAAKDWMNTNFPTYTNVVIA